MQRLRALLLVLIACCIGLQTAWACAMPLCHDTMQPDVVQEQLADAHMHAHDAHADADAHAAMPGDTACTDCYFCHLAGTAILLGAGAGLADLAGNGVMVSGPMATPRSHITEPSLRPPRSLA